MGVVGNYAFESVKNRSLGNEALYKVTRNKAFAEACKSGRSRDKLKELDAIVSGNIKWYMVYKPLSPNSAVAVAA